MGLAIPSRSFEADVHEVKVAVLALAAEKQLDSAVVVAAMADAIGITAASIDHFGHGPAMPLDTRLDSVIARVRQMHRRALDGLARPRAG